VAETIISTETVTQTGLLLTSSGISTNSPQAGVSSIPSATETSNDSPFPHVSSDHSSFRSHQSPLGPIVGGVVAVFALILLFIYLLLRHRASQREIRLRAEIDPTTTGFNLVDTREGLGRHVSVNDNGSRTEILMPRLTGTNSVRSSQTIAPANASLKRAHTNYTLHSPIHDERFQLASGYTSEPSLLQAGGHFQSNSSHDLIPNGAITEEMTHSPTYIPAQSPNETHLQTDFTNIPTDSDYASNSAPPAYDSLPTRSRVNSS